MQLKAEQIKVYRNSGRPVDEADDERYMQEWREFYDKATARAMLDMMKLNRFLSFGAYILQKKHYKPTYVNNIQELADLHVKVGFPLLLGVDANTLEVIAIIQDASGN